MVSGNATFLKCQYSPNCSICFNLFQSTFPPLFLKRLISCSLDLYGHASPHTLRLNKLEGGIAIPDTKHYYYACQLARTLDWGRHANVKQWVKIEQAMTKILLQSLPWCTDRVPTLVSSHLTVGNTCSLQTTLHHLHRFPQPPLLSCLHAYNRKSCFPSWTGRHWFHSISYTG